MKRAIAWILLFLGCATVLWAAPPTAFQEGNDLYKKGQYESSLEKYDSVLRAGLESAALYFNIGNCYFKTRDWGRAVLNYERAARLSPRDADIAFNERLALSKVSSQKIPRSASPAQRLSDFIFGRLTIDEAAMALAAVYLLGLIVIACAILFPKNFNSGWRWGGVGLLLLFLCGVVLCRGRIYELEREGIIVAKSVSAKFEPSQDATTYFELNQGEKIVALETQKDWTKIRRLDGKSGWIPQNAQESIALSHANLVL